MNKNYKKGQRKEYKIIEELKQEGFMIAQRSAGSHSPIDIFAINPETKEILFVQAKPDNFSENKTNKLLEDYNFLNGVWLVTFEVR